MSGLLCPKCRAPLVYGVMSPNNLYVVDMGGVFCSTCDYHQQIDAYYTKNVNSGLQQKDEMDKFKKQLLSNNDRLQIPPNAKKAIV